MITETKWGFLSELGLTKGEARVYICLLSIGQATSGPIIAQSGISSSKVYEILEKLMQKGLVSSSVLNKTKHFQATSPSKLRDYLSAQEDALDRRKSLLEQNLPSLQADYRGNKSPQNAEFFIGVLAIKTMLMDLIEDAKKGGEFLFFGGSGEGYMKAQKEFYKKYDQSRHNAGLKTRGIVLEHYSGEYRSWHSSLRFVPFPTPSNIGIYKDRVAIISWNENPIGILITSKDIADQYKRFFEAIWAIAKH